MVTDMPLDTARYRIFMTGPPGDKPLNPLVLEQSISFFAIIRQRVDHRIHGAFRLGPRKKLALGHLSVCDNGVELVVVRHSGLEGKD